MDKTHLPTALLLVATHCPYCHVLETLLSERMEKGMLGGLEVINVEHTPEATQKYDVRSVPWLQLGDFIFDEALAPVDLDRWIDHAKAGTGQSQYIGYLLERGKLLKAIEWLEQGKAALKDVIHLMADPDARMNVRVGVGAILEHFEASQAIQAIVPDLVSLLEESDQAIRTDACHYLSLTHSIDAIEPLQKMLNDDDEQVREVARESLAELDQPYH